MSTLAAVLIGAMLNPAPMTAETVKVARSQSYSLDGPVIGVSVLSGDRFLLLRPTRVELARPDRDGISSISEISLPEPYGVVRAPAGMIRASDDNGSAWLLTNTANGALLVAVEKDRLVSRLQAAALPWPESSTGVVYQDGTNLLQASLDLLGDGPFLSLAPIGRGLAVMADGRLKIAAPGGGRPVENVRVGPTLAPLSGDLVASSTARPPGSPDEILILAPVDSGYQVAQSLSIEHSIRAIGSRVHGSAALLIAITESPDGTWRLHVLDLRSSTER
ncbi:MAG: hypothetical protein JXO72_04455 [Vicinamibacteria bacterium]|nr:hypothetical protein [Vicinamibacteria bacterium]